MSDDEAPKTPRTSGTWAAFALVAGELALRLRDSATIFERNLEVISMRDAREARMRARVVEGWLAEFSRWPETTPSDDDRGKAIDAFLVYKQDCEDWLAPRRLSRI